MENKKLIAFRESENFSPEEMAKEIKVSKSMYYKIEQGTRNPSYNFIVKIKKRFPYIDANIFVSEEVKDNESA